MAADATLHFDTPETGSLYTVQATGTLIPRYAGYITINVAASSTSLTYPRTLTNFKKTFAISNPTSTTATYNVTTTLTIVPKREVRDTIDVTWGLSQTP
ncbi:hypothetical protein [Clostridium manihotivorum]|uniref:Uncharacterized protein n=1 Tax=Clostridium manihotivorum TaxID=2320868 RepID=A0A3R5U794_9CLOT|nr:hypothetical protein [Clostridium manihotivorum]QAA30596.1 hypothetical protein C1I91_02345 [Clostridium manihotivorum]